MKGDIFTYFIIFFQAVCCLDHIHCCPAGTQCDLSHSTCVSAQGETAMATKIPTAVTGVVVPQSKGENGTVKQFSSNYTLDWSPVTNFSFHISNYPV